jgi:hypothetical protein
MPKVLHIMNEIRASGLERMLECSVNVWRDKNYDLNILGMGNEHPFKENLTKVGYSAYTIPSIKTLNGMAQLIKILRNNSFDIVHIHCESMHGILSVIVKILVPEALIFRTIHNCFSSTGPKRIIRHIQNFLQDRSCSAVVSVSSDVAAHEMNEWGLRTLIIENWIDVDKILSKHSKNLTILSDLPTVTFLGNCSTTKDHEYALSVILEYPDIQVVHIGYPHKSTNYEVMLLAKLEEQGRLIWNSHTDRVIKFLLNSDVHILPSKNEGMSLALMESIGVGMKSWVRESHGTKWASDFESVKFFKSKSDLAYLLEELIMKKKSKHYDTSHKLDFVALDRFKPERGVLKYIALYQSFDN